MSEKESPRSPSRSWRRLLQPRTRILAMGLVAFALAWAALALVGAVLPGEPGLTLTLRAGLDPFGPILLRERVPDIDVDVLADRLDIPHAYVTAQWSGFWLPRRQGPCDVQIRSGAETSLSIDGKVVLHRGEDQGNARDRGQVTLAPGPHPVLVEYRQRTNPPFLAVSRCAEGGELGRLPPGELFRQPPGASGAILRGLAGAASRLLALATLLAAGGLLVTWGLEDSRQRVFPWALLALVLAYGAALRFEFLVGRTWGDEAPAFAVQVEHVLSRLHPHWFVDRPAVAYAGDPWGYLRFARGMVRFYDASVREPLFVFGTKCFLALLDGQNVAVAFASATFSILLILATYLLGNAAFGPWVGLLAAWAVAVERYIVELSVDGWRDDAFAFFVVLCAYAFVLLERKASFGAAVLAGLVGGGACLTRITSLSFLVPAWGYLLWAMPLPLRRRGELVGLAAGLSLLCLAPFLVTCGIVFHDPLYSINYHTLYYRAADLLPDKPTSALRYLVDRARSQPFGVLDTMCLGLTSIPFGQRWTGFDYWRPGLGYALSLASLAGLVLWCFMPAARLLLLVLVTSLVPFAATWNVGGGGGWRFRLFAYPFYLLAAAVALVEVPRFAARLLSRETRPSLGPLLRRAALAAGIGILLWGGFLRLAYLRVGEEIRNGTATVELGAPRDFFFVGPGWTRPVELGSVPVRLCREGCTLALPLTAGAPYVLRIRMDPFPREGLPQAVGISLNGRRLENLAVEARGDGIGSYTVRLPGDAVREGRNELTLGGQGKVSLAVRLVSIGREGSPGPAL